MTSNDGFFIGSRAVGANHPTYIIAEAGVNHRCDMNLATEMVRQAKQAGADAIKFQTYKAETLVTKWAERYWDDTEPSGTQYAIFKKSDHFGPNEYRQLSECCREQDIAFLSTPFDFGAVELLKELEIPAFKIASADITNYPLLKHIATAGKPIIQSLGASTMDEAVQWLKYARDCRIKHISMMHCVLCYPTKMEEANLKRIPLIARRFPDVIVGYSDHTDALICNEISVAAVSLGARIIEKHFTLNRNFQGDDHYHSADPEIFARMVEAIRTAERILGKEYDDVLDCEQKSRLFARRSIIAARTIKKGQRITEDMLIMKRPGTGICPTETSSVIGKTAIRDIAQDIAISWEDLK